MDMSRKEQEAVRDCTKKQEYRFKPNGPFSVAFIATCCYMCPAPGLRFIVLRASWSAGSSAPGPACQTSILTRDTQSILAEVIPGAWSGLSEVTCRRNKRAHASALFRMIQLKYLYLPAATLEAKGFLEELAHVIADSAFVLQCALFKVFLLMIG